MNAPTRRHLLLGSAAAATALATPTYAASSGHAAGLPSNRPPLDRRTVQRWAYHTWRSMVAMTDERTGLPADNINGALATSTRSGYTSPTNIGGYLWSTIVARELKFISKRECSKRLLQTLRTLETMEHHRPSGMYYNWYDEATGDVKTSWPEDDKQVYPFASSVDNGWLGAALHVVSNADREAGPLAARLFRRMRWDMYYDDDLSNPGVRPGGLMHGGFYDAPPPPGFEGYQGNHIGEGPDVWYTNHHYDTCVSETRITSYLGIMTGQVPAKHYFASWRTFTDDCGMSFQESRPTGETRTYLGIDVFEGTYDYRGIKVVPGWGGSMFEELMPDVFVPEATWGPRSWGRNHPAHVRAQIEHGMVEADYGYWGFSPSSNPAGGYREYGVDALGLNPVGYLSDQESTNYDIGVEGCREGTNPNPTFGDGVVTPHAAFLAMMHEPAQAQANLKRIEKDLGAFGPGGFYDAVAVKSGQIAERYLSLDQAMILGAVGNVLGRDVIRRAFATKKVERVLRPVIAMEEFGNS